MAEFLLTAVYIIIFSFVIYKWSFFRNSGLKNYHNLGLFYIKVLASFLLTIIYTHFYSDRSTADIYKYFDDSKVMFDALFTSPADYFKMLTGIGNNTPHFNHYYEQMNNWTRVYESNIYNDSHTIIRFNAFIRLFSFGYFYVHNVFMSFFSFLGLFSIYKVARNIMPSKTALLTIGIFLMPSTVFWSSGVLKEGLIFFALGLLLFSFYQVLNRKVNIFNVAMIIFCMFILVYVKLYILICLIPGAIAYLWVHFSKNKLVLLKYFVVIIVYFAVGVNFYRIFPNYNALEILVRKQADFFGLAHAMNSGSIIKIGILEPNILSFIKNSPQAFANTLLRPFIWEISNPLVLFSALENVFIIFSIIIAIVFRSFKLVDKNFIMFCLIFFISTFILTGLITPVVGAIVRYKVPALPFLMLVLIMIIDQQKLLEIISNFRQKIWGSTK